MFVAFQSIVIPSGDISRSRKCNVSLSKTPTANRSFYQLPSESYEFDYHLSFSQQAKCHQSNVNNIYPNDWQ